MSISVQPLKDYLLTNIIRDKRNISNDEPLFSNGLVDSFGILDLIFFIKEQYNTNMEDFEIADNNIDTLDELASYIEKKAGEK